jgi:hypothetical protein
MGQLAKQARGWCLPRSESHISHERRPSILTSRTRAEVRHAVSVFQFPCSYCHRSPCVVWRALIILILSLRSARATISKPPCVRHSNRDEPLFLEGMILVLIGRRHGVPERSHRLVERNTMLAVIVRRFSRVPFKIHESLSPSILPIEVFAEFADNLIGIMA